MDSDEASATMNPINPMNCMNCTNSFDPNRMISESSLDPHAFNTGAPCSSGACSFFHESLDKNWRAHLIYSLNENGIHCSVMSDLNAMVKKRARYCIQQAVKKRTFNENAVDKKQAPTVLPKRIRTHPAMNEDYGSGITFPLPPNAVTSRRIIQQERKKTHATMVQRKGNKKHIYIQTELRNDVEQCAALSKLNDQEQTILEPRMFMRRQFALEDEVSVPAVPIAHTHLQQTGRMFPIQQHKLLAIDFSGTGNMFSKIGTTMHPEWQLRVAAQHLQMLGVTHYKSTRFFQLFPFVLEPYIDAMQTNAENFINTVLIMIDPLIEHHADATPLPMLPFTVRVTTAEAVAQRLQTALGFLKRMTAENPNAHKEQQYQLHNILQQRAQFDAAARVELMKVKQQEQNTAMAYSQRRREQKRMLAALSAHTRAFYSVHRERRERVHKLAKAAAKLSSLEEQRARAEEDRRQREEEIERANRMRALKENNFEEYEQLVKSQKNERLTSLLNKTDAFLRDLHAKVTKLQEMAELAKLSKDSPEETQQATTTKSELDETNLLTGGELKPYQVAGVNWLLSLFDENLSGILADEMGLGKTVQTIALISELIGKRRNPGPYLIIVPLSTMSNWSSEFERWAPRIKVLEYHGDKAHRLALRKIVESGDFQVLLTSYEMVHTKVDQAKLSFPFWQYIIVDEGHRLRNADSKLASTLQKRYRSANRLLLTGTPLNNNIRELWSLLFFLLPTIFSNESGDSFEEWFSQPFQGQGIDAEDTQLAEEEKMLVIHRLHQVLKPFLLRRIKSEVAKQLPAKQEKVIKIQLSAWQSWLYNRIQGKAAASLAASGKHARLTNLNNSVMQLRKVCNTPYLFYDYHELNWVGSGMSFQIIRSSGKFAMLYKMLPKLKRTGHRVLLFCTMTHVLDLIQEFLNWADYKYVRLDGNSSSEERKERLNIFNAPNSEHFIFIMSTRAGGLGLNLQTADTVILFDSDWNPQQDLQAMDRAHRIGQTREVRVFRFVTISPIEEQVLAKARHKLGMDKLVIQTGKFDQRASDEDRRKMLADALRSGIELEEDSVPTDDDVNRMMARSDEELSIFTQIDQELYANNKALWKHGSLLMLEKELAHIQGLNFVEIGELASKSAPEKEKLGRGNRKRSVVSMREMSDREFSKLISSSSELELKNNHSDDSFSEDDAADGIDSIDDGSDSVQSESHQSYLSDGSDRSRRSQSMTSDAMLRAASADEGKLVLRVARKQRSENSDSLAANGKRSFANSPIELD